MGRTLSVEKWIILVSKRFDELIRSYNDLQAAQSRMPGGVYSGNDPNLRSLINKTHIFWGEQHFLLIALNQLNKSIRQSLKNDPKSQHARKLINKWQKEIKLLRDINEHWEEEGHSLKKFRKIYPKKLPNTFSIGPAGKVTFSGAEIDLAEIQNALHELKRLYGL